MSQINMKFLLLQTLICLNLRRVCCDNKFFAHNHDLHSLKKFKNIFNNSVIAIGFENANGSENIVWGNKPSIEFPDYSKNYMQKDPKIECVRNFYLWTREYKKGKTYELINATDPSSVKYSHFESRHTFIVIHGFLGWGLEGWIIRLKDKLLSLMDCNVISVDWPAGTEWFLPSYYSASGRPPLVGNDTAILIRNLKKLKGLLLKQLHFVGHSLGAHAAGFASKPFFGRVGRISGLDPAGPYFHKQPPENRLDKSDAKYVDVVHTNACTRWPYFTDCYGLDENIGHSDFYPNGGAHQPGCILHKNTLPKFNSSRTIRGSIGCDHEIAYEYFIESLNYYIADKTESKMNSYFVSRTCKTGWIEFLEDNCSCGEFPQYMGINVNSEIDGIFYLRTGMFRPFALEDSDCSLNVDWNMLILVGYILIGMVIFGCLFALMCVLVRMCYAKFCSPRVDDEAFYEGASRLINDDPGIYVDVNEGIRPMQKNEEGGLS